MIPNMVNRERAAPVSLAILRSLAEVEDRSVQEVYECIQGQSDSLESVRATMYKLHRRKVIVRAGYGRYAITPKGREAILDLNPQPEEQPVTTQ